MMTNILLYFASIDSTLDRTDKLKPSFDRLLEYAESSNFLNSN